MTLLTSPLSKRSSAGRQSCGKRQCRVRKRAFVAGWGAEGRGLGGGCVCGECGA